MMPKLKKTHNNKLGFTLVETMVAIFILSMAITSAMTVAQSSLQSSFYARDRIAAYFLAGEAIEMIKNKRDENGIKNFEASASGGAHWLDNIALWADVPGPCSNDSGNPCGVDSAREIIELCSETSPEMNGCELFKETSSGIIGHQDGGAGFTATKFQRQVNMEQINSNEAKVTVTVTWSGRIPFVISEHIFNWHPLSDLE